MATVATSVDTAASFVVATVAKPVDTANNEVVSKSDINDSNTVNSSSKPNAGNRFSRVAGPRIPKR